MPARIKYWFILCLICISAASLAQPSPASETDLRKQADKHFLNAQFTEAAPLYSQLLSLYPKDPILNFRFGVSLVEAGKEKSSAIPYLEFATKNPPVPEEAWLYLGRAYMMGNNFSKASEALNRFKKTATPAKARKYELDLLLSNCANAVPLMNDRKSIAILSAQEAKRTNFYLAYDFSSTSGKLVPAAEQFLSSMDKTKQANPLMFITRDGQNIYYSSYGKSGSTGTDIYLIRKMVNGQWGIPENLGPVINSSENEDYPYLDRDGKTLYFCSRGHNSMGAFDLFKSVFDYNSGQWSPPENLGVPINTAADDFFYVPNLNGDEATYSTSYECKLNEVSVRKISREDVRNRFAVISGTYFSLDQATRRDARITVMRSSDNAVVNSVRTDPKSGKYELVLPPGRDYILVVEGGSYLPHAEQISLPDLAVAGMRQEVKLNRDKEKEQMTVTNFFTPVAIIENEEVLAFRDSPTDVNTSSIKSSGQDSTRMIPVRIDDKVVYVNDPKQRSPEPESLIPAKPQSVATYGFEGLPSDENSGTELGSDTKESLPGGLPTIHLEEKDKYDPTQAQKLSAEEVRQMQEEKERAQIVEEEEKNPSMLIDFNIDNDELAKIALDDAQGLQEEAQRMTERAAQLNAAAQLQDSLASSLDEEAADLNPADTYKKAELKNRSQELKDESIVLRRESQDLLLQASIKRDESRAAKTDAEAMLRNTSRTDSYTAKNDMVISPKTKADDLAKKDEKANEQMDSEAAASGKMNESEFPTGISPVGKESIPGSEIKAKQRIADNASKQSMQEVGEKEIQNEGPDQNQQAEVIKSQGLTGSPDITPDKEKSISQSEKDLTIVTDAENKQVSGENVVTENKSGKLSPAEAIVDQTAQASEKSGLPVTQTEANKSGAKQDDANISLAEKETASPAVAVSQKGTDLQNANRVITTDSVELAQSIKPATEKGTPALSLKAKAGTEKSAMEITPGKNESKSVSQEQGISQSKNEISSDSINVGETNPKLKIVEPIRSSDKNVATAESKMSNPPVSGEAVKDENLTEVKEVDKANIEPLYDKNTSTLAPAGATVEGRNADAKGEKSEVEEAGLPQVSENQVQANSKVRGTESDSSPVPEPMDPKERDAQLKLQEPVNTSSENVNGLAASKQTASGIPNTEANDQSAVKAINRTGTTNTKYVLTETQREQLQPEAKISYESYEKNVEVSETLLNQSRSLQARILEMPRSPERDSLVQVSNALSRESGDRYDLAQTHLEEAKAEDSSLTEMLVISETVIVPDATLALNTPSDFPNTTEKSVSKEKSTLPGKENSISDPADESVIPAQLTQAPISNDQNIKGVIPEIKSTTKTQASKSELASPDPVQQDREDNLKANQENKSLAVQQTAINPEQSKATKDNSAQPVLKKEVQADHVLHSDEDQRQQDISEGIDVNHPKYVAYVESREAISTKQVETIDLFAEGINLNKQAVEEKQLQVDLMDSARHESNEVKRLALESKADSLGMKSSKHEQLSHEKLSASQQKTTEVKALTANMESLKKEVSLTTNRSQAQELSAIPATSRESKAAPSKRNEADASRAHEQKSFNSESAEISSATISNENVISPPELERFAVEMYSKGLGPKYSKVNPIPLNPGLPEGLVFKVQVGAFRKPIADDAFRNLQPVSAETSRPGWIRYCVGLFKTFEPANLVKKELRSRQYKDAFVVAYYNGQRVSLAEANQILNRQDSRVAYAGEMQKEIAALHQLNVIPAKIISGPKDTDEKLFYGNSAMPAKELLEASGPLEYSVQVGVYRNSNPPSILSTLEPIYTEALSKGLYRFTSGRYMSLNEAEIAKKNAIQTGVSDAFVVAFRGNSKVALPARVTETPRTEDALVPVREERISTPDVNLPSSSGKIQYRVQLGAFRNNVPFETVEAFLKISDKGIVRITDERGLNIFYAGDFINYDDALLLKDEIVGKGVKDAFVVAISNGRRVPLSGVLPKNE